MKASSGRSRGKKTHVRYCGNCGEIGYNARTCKIIEEDLGRSIRVVSVNYRRLVAELSLFLLGVHVQVYHSLVCIIRYTVRYCFLFASLMGCQMACPCARPSRNQPIF